MRNKKILYSAGSSIFLAAAEKGKEDLLLKSYSKPINLLENLPNQEPYAIIDGKRKGIVSNKDKGDYAGKLFKNREGTFYNIRDGDGVNRAFLDGKHAYWLFDGRLFRIKETDSEILRLKESSDLEKEAEEIFFSGGEIKETSNGYAIHEDVEGEEYCATHLFKTPSCGILTFSENQGGLRTLTGENLLKNRVGMISGVCEIKDFQIKKLLRETYGI